MNLKICIICKKEFYPPTPKNLCCSVECAKIHKKEWFVIYRKENKEKIQKQALIYRNKNKKLIKDRWQNWIKTHKKYRKERQKEYRLRNHKKLLEQQKKYKQEHKKEILEHLRIKRKTNLNFVLSNSLRSRLYHALHKNIKTNHTLELLGCSVDFLKFWLELQFKDGMTWANYGNGANKWNIDHIRPCASFDLSLEEHQQACFHYVNLQPMWYIDNVTKNAKYSAVICQL